MDSLPKVLVYNWVPAFDPERRGGGVAVYQDNCILAFLKKGWVVHSLSAGTIYDGLGGEPYIIKLEDKLKHQQHSGFALLNSPVVAPSYNSFFLNQISAGDELDEKIAAQLIDFVKNNGPYQSIHFNNIEGLPAKVLTKMRREIQDTRFIFSLHNYYPFCPQVNLWKNNSKNCDGKDAGYGCVACFGKRGVAGRSRRASDAVSELAISNLIFQSRSNPKISFVRRLFRFGIHHLGGSRLLSLMRNQLGSPFSLDDRATTSDVDKLAHYFNGRDEDFIDIINRNFDVILCVSERVKDIAETFGLSPSKCHVSYIGTSFYNNRLPPNILTKDEPLHLAFLGYASKVKGFDFFVSTLEHCSDQILGKISLKIAARGLSFKCRKRLLALKKRLASLTLYAGYNHKQLSTLLKDVELGIVPVVWEDCLPQVAIEFVCHGVPIITSTLGGAREIASNPRFEFSVDNYEDLSRILANFVDEKERISEFWVREPLLKSMETHVSELLGWYKGQNFE